MDFKQLQLPACTKCRENTVTILSSKKTPTSQRRRKHCTFCDYRFTTHEISEEQFKEQTKALAVVKKFKDLLNVTTETIPSLDEEHEPVIPGNNVYEIKCHTCANAHFYGCEFNFPEYNTEEAFDCLQYQLP